MTKEEVFLTAKINTSALDEATRKAERLNDLLKEASALVNELVSKEIKLSVEV